MTTKITREQVEALAEKAQKAKAALANFKDRYEKQATAVVNQVVQSGEVVGTSFLMGIVNGRTGGLEVVGMPVDLGLSAGLHLFAYLGGAGDEGKSHVHNIADGVGASWACTVGTGIGARMRREAEAAARGGGAPQGGGSPQAGGGAASGGALPGSSSADRAMANALALMNQQAA
ncbi:MAG: hypothetical protein SFX73_00790 [Kofleriaceae bacterium]|nr:hypothetical protein [Kofleriaceae bacterium]